MRGTRGGRRELICARAILFGDDELRTMFDDSYRAVMKHLRTGTSITTSSTTLHPPPLYISGRALCGRQHGKRQPGHAVDGGARCLLARPPGAPTRTMTSFIAQQVLYGHVGHAVQGISAYLNLWRVFGFLPEAYNIVTHVFPRADLAAYHLRPEMAESIMYLFRATRDPYWLQAGRDMVAAIQQHAWVASQTRSTPAHALQTPCGYATIENVTVCMQLHV